MCGDTTASGHECFSCGKDTGHAVWDGRRWFCGDCWHLPTSIRPSNPSGPQQEVQIVDRVIEAENIQLIAENAELEAKIKRLQEQLHTKHYEECESCAGCGCEYCDFLGDKLDRETGSPIPTNPGIIAEQQAEIERLREELGRANREIERLREVLLERALEEMDFKREIKRLRQKYTQEVAKRDADLMDLRARLEDGIAYIGPFVDEDHAFGKIAEDCIARLRGRG